MGNFFNLSQSPIVAVIKSLWGFTQIQIEVDLDLSEEGLFLPPTPAPSNEIPDTPFSRMVYYTTLEEGVSRFVKLFFEGEWFSPYLIVHGDDGLVLVIAHGSQHNMKYNQRTAETLREVHDDLRAAGHTTTGVHCHSGYFPWWYQKEYVMPEFRSMEVFTAFHGSKMLYLLT